MSDLEQLARREAQEDALNPVHYSRPTGLYVREPDGSYRPAEVFDIVEAYDLDRYGHCIIKYVLRAGVKLQPGDSPGTARVRDLGKAAWYAQRAAKWHASATSKANKEP